MITNVCTTAEEVWDAITAIGENRGNLTYDIDGAVVKINRFSDREQLGETSKVTALGNRIQISTGGERVQTIKY